MKTILIASLIILFASCNSNDRDRGTHSRTDYQCARDSKDQDPDWQITARVKTALMSDNSLAASSRFVSVETTNGIVTLTGTVPSKEQSHAIERKARAISGVCKVNNQLTIKP